MLPVLSHTGLVKITQRRLCIMCFRILICPFVHFDHQEVQIGSKWISLTSLLCSYLCILGFLSRWYEIIKNKQKDEKKSLCNTGQKEKKIFYTFSLGKKTELLIDGRATLKAVWPRKNRSVAICRKSRKYVDILWTSLKTSYFFVCHLSM